MAFRFRVPGLVHIVGGKGKDAWYDRRNDEDLNMFQNVSWCFNGKIRVSVQQWEDWMELGSLLDVSRALEVGHGILFLSGLIYPILRHISCQCWANPTDDYLHSRCVCCCKSTTAVVWGMEALLSDFSARSRTRTSVAMHSSSHSVTLHVRCKYITLATFGKIHRIWHSDALSIKSSLISLISLLGQAKDRVVPAGWSRCLSQKV